MSPLTRQTLILLKVAQIDGKILIKSGNIKKPLLYIFQTKVYKDDV